MTEKTPLVQVLRQRQWVWYDETMEILMFQNHGEEIEEKEWKVKIQKDWK